MVRASGDKPASHEHGFRGLGCERPYFEPERCGGLVVEQRQAIPSETYIGLASIIARAGLTPAVGAASSRTQQLPPRYVHKLGGLLVRLAGSLSNEK